MILHILVRLILIVVTSMAVAAVRTSTIRVKFHQDIVNMMVKVTNTIK